MYIACELANDSPAAFTCTIELGTCFSAHVYGDPAYNRYSSALSRTPAA